MIVEYRSQLLLNNVDSMSNVLIDIHTHSGGIDLSNFLRNRHPYCQDITDLYFKGKSAAVSHQVVFPMPTSTYYDIPAYWRHGIFLPSGFCNFPFEVENRHLLQSIQQLPFQNNHFLPFLCFSLQEKVKEQEDSIIQAILSRSPIVWGFKFHTSADQKNALQIERESQFIDIATEMQRPILIHTGFNACADPIKVLELASRHPHTFFCAAHFGAFSKTFAKLLKEYPYRNLFFDTSGLISMCNYIRHSERTDVVDLNYAQPSEVLSFYFSEFPERILWGSDSPWYNSLDLNQENNNTPIYTYTQEVDIISDLDKAQLARNALQFLNPL